MSRVLATLVAMVAVLGATAGCRHPGRGPSDPSCAELERRCRSLSEERAVLLERNHALRRDKERLLRYFAGTLSAVSRHAENGEMDQHRKTVSEAECMVKSELAEIVGEER